MGRSDRFSARRGVSAQRRRISANDLRVRGVADGRPRARARGRMRRARHRDEDEEEAEDDSPERDAIGPGADALDRPARGAPPIDFDQARQRRSADGMPGDLDRAPAWRRGERAGIGGRVVLGAREAPAALGRGALEAPPRPRGPLEVVALHEVVDTRGHLAGVRQDRRDLAEARGVLALLTLCHRTSRRARVESQAATGLSLTLALDRVTQVLHVGPPRAGLGLGHASVVVLFRVLTGLADGLALKELALRVGRHDSPQLWVPRFLACPGVLRVQMRNSAVLTAGTLASTPLPVRTGFRGGSGRYWLWPATAAT